MRVYWIYSFLTVSVIVCCKIENVLDKEMQIPIQSWEMSTYPLPTEIKKGI